jgi:hypothetical protein
MAGCGGVKDLLHVRGYGDVQKAPMKTGDE